MTAPIEITAPPTFVRTQQGKKVHRSTCRVAVGGVPWKWANDLAATGDAGVETLHERLDVYGIDACGTCLHPWMKEQKVIRAEREAAVPA